MNFVTDTLRRLPVAGHGANDTRFKGLMIELILLTLFPAMLAAAGIGDFLTMRIPNWLNLAMVAAFFVMAFAVGMPFDLLKWHVAAGLAVLAGGMVVFFSGYLGGGDAKMLAAAALWIGWEHTVVFLVYTILAGGALSVVMLIWQRLKFERDVREAGWAKRLFGKGLQLPYGVAIAAGGIFTFPATWWMQQAI